MYVTRVTILSFIFSFCFSYGWADTGRLEELQMKANKGNVDAQYNLGVVV